MDSKSWDRPKSKCARCPAGTVLAASHSKFCGTMAQKRSLGRTLLNPLHTGGLFHCYMLDKSICHFRGVRSILSLLFLIFLWKILLANNVDPDQMQHYVASDLGLHCLSMILLCVTRSEWIIELFSIRSDQGSKQKDTTAVPVCTTCRKIWICQHLP